MAAAIVVLVLVLGAWTEGPAPTPLGTAPAAGEETLSSIQPVPIVVARAGSISLKLPVARKAVTAIGYHASPDTIALSPQGRQVNEGFFARLWHRVTGSEGGVVSYYELSGGVGVSNGALDIGAVKGTDVFAPINGKILQIATYVVNGYPLGKRIDIRPDDDPTLIVSISRIEVDPAREIGEPVTAGAIRIGSIVDYSKVEKQQLARYTQDPGNHVTIEVRAGALPILS